MRLEDLKIAVVGLGYVGLPLGVSLQKRVLCLGSILMKIVSTNL